MFDELRLCNDGTEASRPCKPEDGDNQMKEKDDEIAHPGTVSKPEKTPNFGCQLRWSTQHLREIYSQVSGILRFFGGVDSSAARPGRAALERWETSPFLAGSIAAAADSYFRSCHAARDFADRRSRP